ncbi:hypothetical protein ACSAGD_01680 [Paramicrobacterium sp. CJ85]|uniref:hypothetical protein n=1 Tax=Paramicrobacterium sp. CJ85 TaxID=3445355 RepID=UPI003F600124
MRRLVPAGATSLLAIALLVGCAPAAGQSGPTREPSVAPTLAPSATQMARGEQNAAELCGAESSAASDDTCTLKDVEIDGDIVFGDTEKVALENVTVRGTVRVSRAAEVRVTSSEIDGDLEATSNAETRVSDTTVGGTLTVDGGKSGVIKKNTVSGDLNCAGNAGVDGAGNSVKGRAEGQCAGLD